MKLVCSLKIMVENLDLQMAMQIVSASFSQGKPNEIGFSASPEATSSKSFTVQ